MFRSRAVAPVVIALLVLALLPGSGQALSRVPGQPPVNPYAGPVGSSTMHGDPASSDTTPYRGPGPRAAAAPTLPLLSVCPTILAGADGYILALCTEYYDRGPTLNVIDPRTLLPVARKHLTAGSLLGGVYAYVDQHDRVVTVDGSGRLLFLAHRRTPAGGWTIVESRAIDLKPALTRACGAAACDAVTTVAPGYNGLVWFGTAQGRAGYADPRTGKVAFRLLGRGEHVANSISTAPAGMAVATDRATYLVRARRDAAGRPGAIRQVWRRAYDRGPARKPGQAQPRHRRDADLLRAAHRQRVRPRHRQRAPAGAPPRLPHPHRAAGLQDPVPRREQLRHRELTDRLPQPGVRREHLRLPLPGDARRRGGCGPGQCALRRRHAADRRHQGRMPVPVDERGRLGRRTEVCRWRST
ncbi:hypothetical protein G5V59_20950 [Nocardioides sp. W3-2-3]|uniref:hypothetical protein n=1 Tax=Nocardioides convexus TaxID=2712224 RepID=UPI0024189CD6|nr:hypothetical protein [Nocardioides convexus]NHA01451.1 hypothetical protein [Nocardioides convexus]